MEAKVTCPICEHEDTRTYYSMEQGLCEDYFFCHHCGYWYQMAYSPYHEGIDLESGTPEEVQLRNELYPLYKDKVELLKIEILPCP